MSRGIDYGLGQTNIDKETGIRFGVIPHHAVGGAWYESSEADYGNPTCPDCGNEVRESKGRYARYSHKKHECNDYACHSCKSCFGSESAFENEPLAHILDDGEYKAAQGRDDYDIFILKSPHKTKAGFCSPCAPGACYLLSADENGEWAYCFGHSMFWDSAIKQTPYPVYSVATGELVPPSG